MTYTNWPTVKSEGTRYLSFSQPIPTSVRDLRLTKFCHTLFT